MTISMDGSAAMDGGERERDENGKGKGREGIGRRHTVAPAADGRDFTVPTGWQTLPGRHWHVPVPVVRS